MNNKLAGLWCDDITFCPEDCKWLDCPRNKRNIRDKTIPHSFFVEIPEDCMKRTKAETVNAVIRLEVPKWQIGQEVSVYFPDTMRKHGICEEDKK